MCRPERRCSEKGLRTKHAACGMRLAVWPKLRSRSDSHSVFGRRLAAHIPTLSVGTFRRTMHIALYMAKLRSRSHSRSVFAWQSFALALILTLYLHAACGIGHADLRSRSHSRSVFGMRVMECLTFIKSVYIKHLIISIKCLIHLINNNYSKWSTVYVKNWFANKAVILLFL